MYSLVQYVRIDKMRVREIPWDTPPHHATAVGTHRGGAAPWTVASHYILMLHNSIQN